MDKNELIFFDACCGIGIRSKKNAWEPPFDGAADLTREMNRLNIAEALVYHNDAKYGEFKAANERLINEITLFNEISGAQGVYASCVLTPDIIWEKEGAEAYVRGLVKKGAKAVRMFPQSHEYVFEDRACGELFALISELRLPLCVDLAEVSWETAGLFLEKHPDVNLIVSRISNWGDDRYFFPLMRDFKNFYLSTDYYKIMGGLEKIVSLFGADNLIFGSGLPERGAGCSSATLIYSDLTKEDKEKIAFGNMKRLINSVVAI